QATGNKIADFYSKGHIIDSADKVAAAGTAVTGGCPAIHSRTARQVLPAPTGIVPKAAVTNIVYQQTSGVGYAHTGSRVHTGNQNTFVGRADIQYGIGIGHGPGGVNGYVLRKSRHRQYTYCQ